MSLLFIVLPALRNSTQAGFKPHLSLIGLIKREFTGIVFYHRNMVELSELSSEADRLRRRLFDLREIERENKRLNRLLRFKARSPLRFLPARVIARSPDSWASSVIIDRGSSNGIRRGMVVVSERGLLGRVAESAGNSSRVLLINDPSQGVPAIVQRTRQQGLVNGSLGGNLIMRYLPDDAQISVGDAIVTSELSRVYPKGLLIGRVVNIGKEFSGLSRYAVIRPAAELSNIEEVLVVVP